MLHTLLYRRNLLVPDKKLAPVLPQFLGVILNDEGPIINYHSLSHCVRSIMR